MKPDISVTDDRKDRSKVVKDHKKIIAGDMLSKDVSLIRREVQEQGCRTNMQNNMMDLQETLRSGGDKLDGKNWVKSTPMDTSCEEILEPETHIEDAISTDRMNHDDIMEINTPATKCPVSYYMKTTNPQHPS